MTNLRTLRTCKKGHSYYKSSDCPVCAVCEAEKKSVAGVFSSLAAPARRALEHKPIKTLEQLSEYSAKEILDLHGMGKTTIPKLDSLLKTKELEFRA
jgi:hypothetical protein